MTSRTETLPRPVEISHRAVLGIAVPMVLAHVSTPLLGLADTAVIGQLGDPALIGAVALSAVLFNFLFWGFGFLRMGTAGLTAQALGAADAVEQRAVLLRALSMALILGLGLIAAQTIIASVAFALLGGSASVTASARGYFFVRIWSAPFALGNYAILGWLIGMGRTARGLALQIGINLFNILLCVGLVMGLRLGVAGTALATTLAEIGGLVAGLGLVALHFGGRLAVPAARIFDPGRVWRMAAVNRDIMIRTVALLAASAFFTRQGARAGDVTLSANAVLNNFAMLGVYFLDGIATAAEQLCGRALGARNRLAFGRAVRLSLGWSVGLSVCLSLGLFLAGGFAIDAMARSDAVRMAARQFLPYAALTPLVGSLAFTFDGVFIGATWNAAMRNLMLLALAVYLAVWWLLLPYGNHGLWLAWLGLLLMRGVGQVVCYPALERRAFGGV